MLEIEIAESKKMSMDGTAVLKSLMSLSMANLDLLVRESLQNSLDAWNGLGNKVKVNYIVDDFDSDDLCSELEYLGEILKNKYKGDAQFLAICDKGTTGLDGPIGSNYEECGKFQKLVYEIAKTHTSSTSDTGGSWGYGKTIYYHIGNGLVFFYSRFKDENGNYKSRLAGTYIEDNSSNNPQQILKHNKVNRGIAWFGKKENGETVPIENEDYINDFLKIFDLKPYKGDDTGTVIVIPIVDERKLLKEIKEKDTVYKTYRTDCLEDYLELASKKWYFPRMNNLKYYQTFKKAFLELKINEEKVFENPKIEEALFDVYQKMYNCCLDKINGENISQDGYIVEVCKQKPFQKSRDIACYCFKKFTKEELNIREINSDRNPFEILGLDNTAYSNNENRPIVAYCRKPGMIVNYEISNLWADEIQSTNNDEYLLVMVVANSNSELIDDFTIENYFRNCEIADHNSWNDRSFHGHNLSIIKRLAAKIKKNIKEYYKNEDIKIIEGKKVAMGGFLAKLLLPQSGFGNTADPNGEENVAGGGGSTGGGGTGQRISKNTLKLNDSDPPKYLLNSIILKNELIVGSKTNNFSITLNVLDGSSKIGISLNDLVKLIPDLPVRISKISFEIKKYTDQKRKKIVEIKEFVLSNHVSVLLDKDIIIKPLILDECKDIYGFEVELQDEKYYYSINVSSIITVNDKSFICRYVIDKNGG